MEQILSYLMQNKLFTIVLLAVGAYIVSRLLAPAYGKVRKEDLVPAYKRFNRRDDAEGNRRHERALVFTGVERRTDLRRAAAY